MIKYALACAEGHTFTSWFPDSEAYETQRKRGLIACPECGSVKVDKAIMAPAVVGGERVSHTESPMPAILDDRQRAMREMRLKLRRAIEAHTDDVGQKFPELARAMHDGDAPERPIRGQASSEEARSLLEEGISVMPLPDLADELN